MNSNQETVSSTFLSTDFRLNVNLRLKVYTSGVVLDIKLPASTWSTVLVPVPGLLSTVLVPVVYIMIFQP